MATIFRALASAAEVWVKSLPFQGVRPGRQVEPKAPSLKITRFSAGYPGAMWLQGSSCYTSRAMSAQLNTTTEAEGLPRRRFTFEEVERMVRLGILLEDERIELIGGEIVPMSPKGGLHEVLKSALTIHWARRLPDDLLFTTETTFRLSRDTYLEPDFVFYPKEGGWRGLTAGTAKLVVEISDSSLSYDLGRKAKLYAGFGLVELWVIDAAKLTTRIHREPKPERYGLVSDHQAGDRLVPTRAPDLAVTLADLDIR